MTICMCTCKNLQVQVKIQVQGPVFTSLFNIRHSLFLVRYSKKLTIKQTIMKLKICVLLILACTTLLASPRKYPCPQADTASVRIEKANAGATLGEETELLPMHSMSASVL